MTTLPPMLHESMEMLGITLQAIPQKSPCACSLERRPSLTQLIKLRLGLSQGPALHTETLTMLSKALPFLCQVLGWDLP